MILHHNIKNSDDNRNVKHVVEEQEQNQFKNKFYQKCKKLPKIYKLVMSAQPVNQNGKKR